MITRIELGLEPGEAGHWHRRVGATRSGSVHGERAKIRHVLHLAARMASRFNPMIRAFAEHLRAPGKPHKVVMTATMRRLLVLLDAMVRVGSLWPNSHGRRTPLIELILT